MQRDASVIQGGVARLVANGSKTWVLQHCWVGGQLPILQKHNISSCAPCPFPTKVEDLIGNKWMAPLIWYWFHQSTAKCNLAL